MKVLFWISGDDSMKVSTDVCFSNGGQNIRHDILGEVGDISVFKELDSIRNETAFGHGEEIIEWFESFLPFARLKASFAPILFVDL